MPWYALVSTTTVATTSVSIISGVAEQDEVEILAADASVWVKMDGGSTAAAVAAADGNLFIPKDTAVVVKGKTGYHAIRDSATARVQVARVSP